MAGAIGGEWATCILSSSRLPVEEREFLGIAEANGGDWAASILVSSRLPPEEREGVRRIAAIEGGMGGTNGTLLLGPSSSADPLDALKAPEIR